MKKVLRFILRLCYLEERLKWVKQIALLGVSHQTTEHEALVRLFKISTAQMLGRERAGSGFFPRQFAAL